MEKQCGVEEEEAGSDLPLVERSLGPFPFGSTCADRRLLLGVEVFSSICMSSACCLLIDQL